MEKNRKERKIFNINDPKPFAQYNFVEYNDFNPVYLALKNNE